MADYAVVLFASTAHALRAEKVLTQAGVPIKLIPTPRQFSTDCGLALRFEAAAAERVEAALAEQGAPFRGIHPLGL
ncbi:MAG TPA: DUF3343 domain-containing protein [Anaerolineae bacterium]|nr:DUF3343 domain-containing protein [Anaerolineae bacterium]